MDPPSIFQNGSQQQGQATVGAKVQHTPPSSLEQQGSPTKRARLDASVAQPSQGQEDVAMPLAAAEEPHVPLQQLPLPLLLLTLAQACHSTALSLHPALARRPSTAAGSNAQQRYAQNWSSYTRLLASTIALLRKVVELTQGGAGGEGAAGGKMELTARVMLAEVLGLCDGSARAEREKVASRGLVAAEKHPSLDLYKPYLILQQIQTTLSSLPSASSTSSSTSTQLKFARTTLRRLLSTPAYSSQSLPAPPPSTTTPGTPLGKKDLPNPSWTYSFTLLAATLPATPYAEALASWREIERVATIRGDEGMRLVAEIGKARLALGEGAWEVVGASISSLDAALGWSATSPEGTATGQPAASAASDLLPAALQIQGLLIAALYFAHMGQNKVAKEKLKGAHKLLDSEVEKGEEQRGEKEGWCVIPITPSSSNPPPSTVPTPAPLHSPIAVTLKLPTRAMVYQFAFLVSVAVHRDPFGSRPRSILFVNEGLKLVDGKLSGSEHPPPLTTPANITSTLLASAELKIHLLLFSAELSLMRSAWAKAESDLHLAITTARLYAPAGDDSEEGGELWQRYKSRITLGMGLLAQGRGEDAMAEDCFETVLMDDPTSLAAGGGGVASSSKMSRRKSAGAGGDRDKDGDDLNEEMRNTFALAKMSLIILKISQGIRVRLSTSSSGGSSSNLAADLASDARLTALARSLAALPTSSGSSPVPPAVQLIAEVTQALTKGEITKAKQHLSVALGLANSTGSNHAKALLLGLLGNLFVWTRNDQAQKMLLASLHIARGMGARPDTRTKEQQAADKAAGIVRENEVGAARLGLWVGEKLSESYKRDDPVKYRKQEALNQVHREVLQKEWRGDP